MKFITGDTGITAAIEMRDEPVHQIKKVIFGAVVMQSVQPVDFVASHQLVMVHHLMISCTRVSHEVAGAQRGDVVCQKCRQRMPEKIIDRAYVGCKVTPDEFVEDDFQIVVS